MTFNTAISGMKAASTQLDNTGNNVANAGTAGFKASRVEFADVFAATSLGTSAVAIGGGTRLSNVRQLFSQGTIAATDNNLDLAINGEGFFTLNDGGSLLYARAGNFGLDRDGFIVNPQGHRLTGLLADINGNISGAQGDLQINTSNIAPNPTSTFDMGLNLPADGEEPPSAWVGSPTFGSPVPAADTYNHSTSSTVFDSLGEQHVLTVYFRKTATANTWDLYTQIDGVDVDANPAGAPFTQVFNNTGSFDAGSSEDIVLNWTPLDNSGNANGSVAPQAITLNLNDATQFGSPFAVHAISQNGFATGRLDSVEVDSSGIIFGRYTNGQSQAMGQLQLANFANTQGLSPLGDSTFGETFTSGQPLLGRPGTSSLGVIQSGSLEQSNVDIAKELVTMIIAQRNFQANAQTIKTNDATTQTIINIK